jgi:hypothetical protein
MINEEDLKNRFAFHPPQTEAVRQVHVDVRMACLDLALFINQQVPAGREKSLAITHLEEVMMWANKAIANSRPQDAVHG